MSRQPDLYCSEMLIHIWLSVVCELTTLHFKGKRQLEIMGGKKKRYVGSGHHRWRSSPQAVITAGGLYRRRSSPLAVLTVLGLAGS